MDVMPLEAISNLYVHFSRFSIFEEHIKGPFSQTVCLARLSAEEFVLASIGGVTM
jgi:hypothetical protein